MKQAVMPISLAVLSFIAGGLLLSSFSVSAANTGSSIGVGAHMRQGPEFSDELKQVIADLLDISVEELETAHENREVRDLVEAAGYDTRADFHEAVEAAAEEAGIELPAMQIQHRHMHQNAQ